MRRVLVTGASGFVGSFIAEAFVRRGDEVRAAVRPSSSLAWLAGLPLERVTLRLDRPDELAAALQGVELVVHAAGLTRARREADYFAVNVEGTRALMQAAVQSGVRRVVLVSSLAARGPDERPGSGEDHPTSAYGQSKLEAERVAFGYGSALEVVILRLAGVYGPRDRDFLALFQLARRGLLILPRAAGVLQLLYAPDAADAAVLAAEAPVSERPLAIAEAQRYDRDSFARLLGEAVGRQPRLLRLPVPLFEVTGSVVQGVSALIDRPSPFDRRRAEDVARYRYTCDVAEAEHALGWQAATPLAEGLARTARWYREQGWLR
jgi:nucleoside-diphosphate-sugar epimerase